MFQVIKPHSADAKASDFAKATTDTMADRSAECKREGERLVCKELPETHEIKVEAIDRDALLVDFLSEALYLSDVNNEAYLDVEINELSDTTISATLRGIKITGFEVVEIKAVTHHDLKIKEIDGMWQVDIVFDI